MLKLLNLLEEKSQEGGCYQHKLQKLDFGEILNSTYNLFNFDKPDHDKQYHLIGSSPHYINSLPQFDLYLLPSHQQILENFLILLIQIEENFSLQNRARQFETDQQPNKFIFNLVSLQEHCISKQFLSRFNRSVLLFEKRNIIGADSNISSFIRFVLSFSYSQTIKFEVIKFFLRSLYFNYNMDRIREVHQILNKVSTSTKDYDYILSQEKKNDIFAMLQNKRKSQGQMIDERQYQLLNNFKLNPIAKDINKTKIFDLNSIANLENFKAHDYISISIQPLVTDQVKNMLAIFIQLQEKIDPQTMDFFKIKNTDISQIVKNALKLNKLDQIWEFLVTYFQNENQINEWMAQIMKISYQLYRKYDFQVDQTIFFKALLNQKVYTPIQQSQIEKIQNKAFNEAQKKAIELNLGNICDFEKQSILHLLKIKKQQLQKQTYFFFEQSKQIGDFRGMLISKLTNQIQKS